MRAIRIYVALFRLALARWHADRRDHLLDQVNATVNDLGLTHER